MKIEERIYDAYRRHQIYLFNFENKIESIKNAKSQVDVLISNIDIPFAKDRLQKLQKYIHDETEELKNLSEKISEIIKIIPEEDYKYLYKFGTHKYIFIKSIKSLIIKVYQERVDQLEDIVVSEYKYEID